MSDRRELICFTCQMESNSEDMRLCWRCIGERYLRAKVRDTGEQTDCSYCAKQAKTVSLLKLSEEVPRSVPAPLQTHAHRSLGV